MADTGNARQMVNAPGENLAPAPPAVAPPGAIPDRSPVPTSTTRPPRRAAQGQPVLAPTVHPLFATVANVPFFLNFGAYSTFVPSALAMYNALGHMDAHMATIRRFYENAPMWLPLISQAYFGILWIIHILRCMSSAGLLSTEHATFLANFENSFPFATLAIPGPLVPFFQAIGVCAAAFPQYGDIVPTLPKVFGNRAAHWLASNGLERIFPPVHLFVDQLNYIAGLTAESINLATTHPVRIWVDIFGTANTATGVGIFKWIDLLPGVATPFNASPSLIQSFWHNRNALQLPTRLSATTGPAAALPIDHYLRLRNTGGNTFNWFAVTVSIMQRYCQFFSGSTSLAGIPVTGYGASIPTWKFLPNGYPVNTTITEHTAYNTGRTTGQGAAIMVYQPNFHLFHSLNSLGVIMDPTLLPNADGSDPSRLARQCASITQVHVLFTSLDPPDEGMPSFPAVNALENGPEWDLIDLSTSPPTDPALYLPLTILGMFVNDTRIN